MIENVRGCLGKSRYDSERLATAVKNRVWFQRQTALRVYACTDCGGYHLTRDRAEAPVGERFGPPRRPYRERQEHGKRMRRRRR